MKVGLIYFFAFIVIVSCKPSQNLVYFSDIKESEYITKVQERAKPRIQADDLLGITVSTLSPESNALFNSGVLQKSTSKAGIDVGTSTENSGGYLVDENGYINFPVVG